MNSSTGRPYLGLVPMCVVSVAEADLAVLAIQEALVANGDLIGIAPEVAVKHRYVSVVARWPLRGYRPRAFHATRTSESYPSQSSAIRSQNYTLSAS